MNSNAQNILMVIPSLEIGGAQSNLLRLATEFHRNGRTVMILELKPNKRDQEYVDSLLNKHIPIFSPPFFKRNIRHSVGGWLERRNKMQRLILKLRPENTWLKALLHHKDIGAIHSHMYLADLYLSKNITTDNPGLITLSKQCGCYNLIDSQLEVKDEGPFNQQLNQIFSLLNGVVTMTSQHEDFLSRKSLKTRKERIYNGISLPEIESTKDSPNVRCVMCARDEPTKGWEAAILGVLSAHSQGHKVSLDLIGDGQHLDKLHSQFKNEDIIRFLGAKPNPMALLANYDVGLLPSTFKAESLPNTVVEYQAAGLATIATSIGEIPNLVSFEKKDAGFIIQTGTQQEMGEQIASALAQYASESSTLKQHKQAAYILRKRFDIRNTAASYLAFSDALKTTS